MGFADWRTARPKRKVGKPMTAIPQNLLCPRPNCFVLDIALVKLAENTYQCPNCDFVFGEELEQTAKKLETPEPAVAEETEPVTEKEKMQKAFDAAPEELGKAAVKQAKKAKEKNAESSEDN